MTRTLHGFETYTFRGMNEKNEPIFSRVFLIGDTIEKANAYAKRNKINAIVDKNAISKTLVTKMSDDKWIEFCEIVGIYDGHINPANIKATATETDTETATETDTETATETA